MELHCAYADARTSSSRTWQRFSESQQVSNLLLVTGGAHSGPYCVSLLQELFDNLGANETAPVKERHTMDSATIYKSAQQMSSTRSTVAYSTNRAQGESPATDDSDESHIG